MERIRGRRAVVGSSSAYALLIMSKPTGSLSSLKALAGLCYWIKMKMKMEVANATRRHTAACRGCVDSDLQLKG